MCSGCENVVNQNHTGSEKDLGVRGRKVRWREGNCERVELSKSIPCYKFPPLPPRLPLKSLIQKITLLGIKRNLTSPRNFQQDKLFLEYHFRNIDLKNRCRLSFSLSVSQTSRFIVPNVLYFFFSYSYLMHQLSSSLRLFLFPSFPSINHVLGVSLNRYPLPLINLFVSCNPFFVPKLFVSALLSYCWDESECFPLHCECVYVSALWSTRYYFSGCKHLQFQQEGVSLGYKQRIVFTVVPCILILSKFLHQVMHTFF